MEEIFARIGFDPRMALFSAVNFLVFFWLINKLVLGKVAKALEVRQEQEKNLIRNSEKLQNELAEAKKKAAELIADASQKANEIVQEKTDHSLKLAAEIKTKAADDVKQMRERVNKQLKKDEAEMLMNLKQTAAQIAVQGAEKILRKELTNKEDMQIINSYLEILEKK